MYIIPFHNVVWTNGRITSCPGPFRPVDPPKPVEPPADPLEKLFAMLRIVAEDPRMATQTVDTLWWVLWQADMHHYAEQGQPMFLGIEWIKTETGVRARKR